MKIGKLAIITAGVALLFLSAGCAGSKSLVLTPFETQLDPFTSVYFSTESSLVEDVTEQMSDLEVMLMERLHKSSYFSSAMLGECPDSCEKALIIKAEIIDIRKVGGTSRFMLGAFAGEARLTADVTFIDGGTGSSIGAYAVTGTSGGTGYSGGTGDAVKKVAEEIMKIIKENF